MSSVQSFLINQKNDIDDPCAKLAQSLRDQWELVQGHILNNSLRDLAIARGVHLVLAETVRQPCTKKSQKSTLTKGSTEQTLKGLDNHAIQAGSVWHGALRETFCARVPFVSHSSC